LGRKNLKEFTKISFYIALATIIVLPIALFSSTIVLNETLKSIIKGFTLITFLASVFGIPLSIFSMFSKENLAKRIFSLIVNALPISIVGYALIMEFIDEFFRTAP
jgi:predicted neutral ceramidase superfamily lipid hydrolase